MNPCNIKNISDQWKRWLLKKGAVKSPPTTGALVIMMCLVFFCISLLKNSPFKPDDLKHNDKNVLQKHKTVYILTARDILINVIDMTMGIAARTASAAERNPSVASLRNLFIEHYFSGTEHHRRGDLERAEREYLQAKEIEPNNPSILNLLGSLYRQKGDIDKAISMFKRTLEMDRDISSLIRARCALGDIYLSQESYKKALLEFEKCVNLDQDISRRNVYKLKINRCETHLHR